MVKNVFLYPIDLKLVLISLNLLHCKIIFKLFGLLFDALTLTIEVRISIIYDHILVYPCSQTIKFEGDQHFKSVGVSGPMLERGVVNYLLSVRLEIDYYSICCLVASPFRFNWVVVKHKLDKLLFDASAIYICNLSLKWLKQATIINSWYPGRFDSIFSENIVLKKACLCLIPNHRNGIWKLHSFKINGNVLFSQHGINIKNQDHADCKNEEKTWDNRAFWRVDLAAIYVVQASEEFRVA